MKIYMINLYSTSELWDSYVCSNMDAVIRVLDSHGITSRVLGFNDSAFQEWVRPDNESQTATVSKVTLIER